MEQDSPTIYVIDGDSSVRRAMKRLLLSSHMQAKTFASIDEFLRSGHRDRKGCLVVDVSGSGAGSLELQLTQDSQKPRLPVIFITSTDTSEVRGRLKKAGAVGYLRKPVDDQALLDTILWAMSNQPQVE